VCTYDQCLTREPTDPPGFMSFIERVAAGPILDMQPPVMNHVLGPLASEIKVSVIILVVIGMPST
jgi:hypothetical protein